MTQFSYSEYKKIIRFIKSNYDLLNFHQITSSIDRFCVIRHDVEFSIDRALQLAELESDLKISTTYLFQIRNNCYNSISIQNVQKIRKIHELGHEIGLHVHHGMANEYDTIENMILKDVELLSSVLKINIKVFSFHRPTSDILISNFKINGLINAYGDLFFHHYKETPPKELKVKYISDSNHQWKFGYPTDIIYPKLQLNFHPFSWTVRGFNNAKNFKTLLTEKRKEIINSIANEIKTFPDRFKNDK